jgi:UDP-N-acetyl-D-mannosaminuronic acid dehydrogenase
MSLDELQGKIENRSARIGVIGLGYVGLPVAAMFADAGFQVTGIEIREDRVQIINSGKSPIEGDEPGLSDLLSRVAVSKNLITSSNYESLKDCDVVLIDVETPVDEHHIPRYQALQAALKSLSGVIKDGTLVVVESTIAPGTMRELVLPTLEAGGRKVNRDFFLGNCPERVMPGRLLQNLRTLSRVVGGGTPETAKVMMAMYSLVVKADLDPVDWVTAELVKTVENAYRDVQIAFANEVALICEEMGADIWKVRELVNKSPYRQMHLPGAGVGGHCIPKDPWLLAYGVRDSGLPLRLIPAAREVNEWMPRHMAETARKALAAAGKEISSSRVLLMGYAYLENSDDTRNSPSEAAKRVLLEMGAQVVVHDPFVNEYQGDLLKMAQGCDLALVMVKHDAYVNLDLDGLRKALNNPILIDGRAVYSPEAAVKAGLIYLLVGRADQVTS